MIDKIRKEFNGKYAFTELERSPDKFNDLNDIMVLYKINKTEEIK
jgi:hypothetical protein